MHFDDGKTYRSVLSEANSSANLKKICNRLEVSDLVENNILERITWDIIQRCPRFRAQKEFLDPIYIIASYNPNGAPYFGRFGAPIKYGAGQPIFPPRKSGRRPLGSTITRQLFSGKLT